MFVFLPLGDSQLLNLTVKGGPLPFAFDILSAAFCYGNRVFTKYPEGKTDYFKQAFPGGLSWERTMTFEDGGICTVTAEIRYKLFVMLMAMLVYR